MGHLPRCQRVSGCWLVQCPMETSNTWMGAGTWPVSRNGCQGLRKCRLVLSILGGFQPPKACQCTQFGISQTMSHSLLWLACHAALQLYFKHSSVIKMGPCEHAFRHVNLVCNVQSSLIWNGFPEIHESLMPHSYAKPCACRTYDVNQKYWQANKPH